MKLGLMLGEQLTRSASFEGVDAIALTRAAPSRQGAFAGLQPIPGDDAEGSVLPGH